MATRSSPWTLGPAALASLIDRLGAGDPREYEVVRRKLIAFMSWRGVTQPEAAADETLDRVARKLEEGLEIEGENIRAYVFGVARRVVLEVGRQERRNHAVQEAWALLNRQADAEEGERRLACLERCLAGLSPEDRAIVEAYHGPGEESAHHRRSALGGRLGLTGGALRIRVFRIRNRLADCRGRCLQRRGGNE
jgi:DNA-directed RNA polymerase specialized sigma24 family protein